MREIFPHIQRPCHYLGDEFGAVRKPGREVKARVALAFPDLYEVGMSYLGQKILYEAVNRQPGLAAERVYAPAVETAAVMRERGALLATLETDTPLDQVDVLAFSLTHELCYTNVLYMLDLAGLPLRAASRDARHPLVVAGGGCVFNAEPVAPFFDLMVLGDGEEILVELLQAVGEARKEGLPRRDLLLRLKDIPGVYVPSFFADGPAGGPPRPLIPGYERVEKRILTDLDSAPFPTAQPVPAAKSVHDRLTVEIARGCTRGCRFCQAGMIYRPVRERSVAAVDGLIEQGLARTGFEEVSFLSLSTGDFSALEALFAASFARCRAGQVAISLPSLRVGSVSESIMARMAEIRRTGVTIAPEAGSQRLRDVINKGVTEEGLFAHMTRLFEHGWQQVKFYFMLGLPTETFEDLEAIPDLCRRVAMLAGPEAKRIQVTAAVSPFVPKAHTPFQWERQLGLEEVRERVGFLRDIVRRNKRLTLRWHEPEMSWLEGVFSRGDRALAPAVERAYQLGALFSSWSDHLDIEKWRQAFAETGIDADSYLGARDPESPLPWSHLTSGVSERFLRTELRRAREGRITPDCRFETCRNCGVCNTDGRPSELTRQSGLDISPRVINARRDQEEAVPDAGPQAQSAPDLAARAGHFRLWYLKTGLSRYLSQLELQRVFERAMRRADIPLSFSQGYHPMPLISFGRALPVGVESTAEWLNLFIRDPLSPEELLARLTPQLPATLRPYRAEVLPPSRKQPQSASEEYILRYAAPGDTASLWSAFVAAPSFQAVVESKKGQRNLDLRPLVASCRALSPGLFALALDWSVDYLNPRTLITLVTPEAPFRLRKVRQTFGE